MPKEGFPQTPPQESTEGAEGRSMNADEAKQFLEEHGATPLEQWEPHQSFVYVLPDYIRQYDHFITLPPEHVPSISVIHDPVELLPRRPEGNDLQGYQLINGGRVDYYSVDPDTKAYTLVKTSHRITTLKDPYFIEKENLYTVPSGLFK